MSIRINIKRVHPSATIPVFSSDHATACDLYSVESVTINPGETKKIPTGICLEIPSTHYFRIEGRSGLSSKGIMKLGGIVDPDYRGEIQVILHNGAKEPYAINVGDRIAQGILTQRIEAIFEEVDELGVTSRGSGGFGSTGV